MRVYLEVRATARYVAILFWLGGCTLPAQEESEKRRTHPRSGGDCQRKGGS